LFNSDVQSALLFLISLTSTKHDLLSLQIVVSKFDGWKGRHFCARLWATQPRYATEYSSSDNTPIYAGFAINCQTKC